jgi:hypothetical protein
VKVSKHFIGMFCQGKTITQQALAFVVADPAIAGTHDVGNVGIVDGHTSAG